MAKVDEIRERLSKITPWPWEETRPGPYDSNPERCYGIRSAKHSHSRDQDCYDVEGCPGAEEIVTTDSGYYGPRRADAEFIVHAPEDVSYLLDELHACRDQVELLRPLFLDIAGFLTAAIGWSRVCPGTRSA